MMRPSPTRTSRSSQPQPQPRHVTERNTCSPLTRHPAPPARAAGTPIVPSPPARACSSRRCARSRRRCRSAARAAIRSPGVVCRPSAASVSQRRVARGVTSRRAKTMALPCTRLNEGLVGPGSRPAHASDVKREEREVRASARAAPWTRRTCGFTSIGQGIPDRAMKSTPLRPTSPNARATAAASASALCVQRLFRREQGPDPSGCRSSGSRGRRTPRARPAGGRCRARGHRGHRPRNTTEPGRPGSAPGGTRGARRDGRDARPRSRVRRPAARLQEPAPIPRRAERAAGSSGAGRLQPGPRSARMSARGSRTRRSTAGAFPSRRRPRASAATASGWFSKLEVYAANSAGIPRAATAAAAGSKVAPATEA